MVAGGNVLHKIVPDQGHNDQSDEFTTVYQKDKEFGDFLKLKYKGVEVKEPKEP